MPKYVDGFVLPVIKSKLAAYKRMAKLGGKIWRDHGALEYRECVGEDMDMKWGLPFPRGIKARKGEIVIFAWIVYKSRADRDRVNALVMKDPRMKMEDKPMPFDIKRMLYGGFEVLVDM